jgi:hypothetical protein
MKVSYGFIQGKHTGKYNTWKRNCSHCLKGYNKQEHFEGRPHYALVMTLKDQCQANRLKRSFYNLYSGGG